MNYNTETMRSMNDFLQGEYMAIESFNHFIANLEDGHTKHAFQDIQKQHRKNADTLATYIQNAGGRPDENLGFKGIMGDMMLGWELGAQPDADVVIKKAIEGETKGINMAEKVLRGNLDDKSRDLVGKILQNDRGSIEKLKGLL